MFGDYIEAFDSNLTNVVQFTGVAILVLGFSNFIWYECWLRSKGILLMRTTGCPYRPVLGEGKPRFLLIAHYLANSL